MIRLAAFGYWIGLLLIAGISGARAGDWPQILGPNRNGAAAADEKLPAKWPSGGPKLVWEQSAGSGYAGVAVQGDVAILFHRVRSEEVVEALNIADGASRWKHAYPTTFYPQVGGGDGPLCVPTITGDAVVTYGAQGILSCVDLTTGKLRWERATHKDYGAKEGYFGAGSTPVVIGESVIVNVGGDRKQAGVVAFSLLDGKELWKGINDEAGYSAPVQVDVDGLPHAFVISRLKCTLMDAKSGAVRFQFPFGSRGPTVNGATPLVWDDNFFITSSYGVGAISAQFDLLTVEPYWEKDEVLSSQYCTPVLHDGMLYGIHGRDDIPPADLKCIDPETGKTLWVEHNFGYGTLILADGKIIAAKTDGNVALIRATPEQAVISSKFRAVKGTLRALPALSNGKLYVRDEQTLKCFAVDGM